MNSKNKKIGAVIQARTASTRLPEKIFKSLDGIPLIEQIILKVKKSEFIDDVIIATTDKDNDLKLVNWCKLKNIKCFTGDAADVLSRYYYCAKYYELDVIIRITSDNPLIDIEIVNKVIKLFEDGYDYAANNYKKTFPHGLDVEVMSFSSLEESFKKANKEYEREHVTQYIRHNPKIFKIGNLESGGSYHNIRITVDTSEDLKLVREIVKIGGINIKFNDIINIFKDNIKLLETNMISMKNHKIYNKKNNII